MYIFFIFWYVNDLRLPIDFCRKISYKQLQ
jgi:hypothetical protein